MQHDPIKTLAENVSRLMAHKGMTQEALSTMSGVGQTTLSSLLRYGTSSAKKPRLDTTAALARALDVEPWMLLIPDLPIDVLLDNRVSKVIDNYAESGPEGRKNIHRVAEQEARYEAFSGGQEKAG